MFCMHCGVKLPEDSNFCAKCGAKVAHSEERHTVEESVEKQPLMDMHRSDWFDDGNDELHGTRTLFALEPKRKLPRKTKIIIGGIACLILVVIAAIGAFAFANALPANIYSRGMSYLDRGLWWEAEREFLRVPEYRDVTLLVEYVRARSSVSSSTVHASILQEIMTAFKNLGDFRDSHEQFLQTRQRFYDALVEEYDVLYKRIHDINAAENYLSDALAIVEARELYARATREWQERGEDASLFPPMPPPPTTDSAIGINRLIEQFAMLGDFGNAASYAENTIELLARFRLIQEEIEPFIAAFEANIERERLALEQERTAQENAAFIQANIIGRWVNPNETMEFFEDGNLESVTIALGLVVFGRYFFDDGALVIRIPVLGLETERRPMVYMTSVDELQIDGHNFTRSR